MSDKWMTCTSCHAVVQLNATGTCLGCQGGFNPLNEEDKYVEPVIDKLIERKEELEKEIKKCKKNPKKTVVEKDYVSTKTRKRAKAPAQGTVKAMQEDREREEKTVKDKKD